MKPHLVGTKMTSSRSISVSQSKGPSPQLNHNQSKEQIEKKVSNHYTTIIDVESYF
jgi:hypothetical protein